MNYWTEHSSNDSSAEVQGAAVTYYVPIGRRHDEGGTLLCSEFRLQIKNRTKPWNRVFCFRDTTLSSWQCIFLRIGPTCKYYKNYFEKSTLKWYVSGPF